MAPRTLKIRADAWSLVVMVVVVVMIMIVVVVMIMIVVMMVVMIMIVIVVMIVVMIVIVVIMIMVLLVVMITTPVFPFGLGTLVIGNCIVIIVVQMMPPMLPVFIMVLIVRFVTFRLEVSIIFSTIACERVAIFEEGDLRWVPTVRTSLVSRITECSVPPLKNVICVPDIIDRSEIIASQM